MAGNSLDLSLANGYEPWMELAYCRTHERPDMWHGDTPAETTEAKILCRTICPVADACLKHAMEHDEREGVWGGLSQNERARIRNGTSALSACERNHPDKESRFSLRGNGERRCQECEAAYTRKRREAA